MKAGILAIIIVVIAAIGFGVYYVMNRSEEPSTVLQTNQIENSVNIVSETNTTAPEVPVKTDKEFAFEVADGKVTEKPEQFEVTQGDDVVITVLADISDEVHLHGYDISTGLTAGSTARLTFNAETAGRFEIELEEAKITLGFLEVQPK
jgi:hypothetical protein